jgi:hypothetical protein
MLLDRSELPGNKSLVLETGNAILGLSQERLGALVLQGYYSISKLCSIQTILGSSSLSECRLLNWGKLIYPVPVEYPLSSARIALYRDWKNLLGSCRDQWRSWFLWRFCLTPYLWLNLHAALTFLIRNHTN